MTGHAVMPAIAAADLVGFVDWLLSLSHQSVADANVELGWRYPLAAWVWALIVLGAALVGAWSYRRLLGSRAPRVALAVARAALIVLIVLLLAGPELVVWSKAREADRLLVLIDRSESMSIEDMLQDGSTEPLSRDQVLRQALLQHAGVFETEQFTLDRSVVWLGFDAGVFALAGADDLPSPTGTTTAIRTAIDQALNGAADQRICGIVLMTDGRSSQDTGAGLVQKLRRQGVSVFTVPLGAKEPALDLAIAQIDRPDKAFVNDIIPVSVHLRVDPADMTYDPQRVRVRLIDPNTQRVLDEARPSDRGLNQPIRLSTTSTVVGPVTWRVELIYEPAEGEPAELITQNNQRQIVIDLIDRPIRVLYVEGYPRWEYRYLKNVLVREKSIESSMMLISADRYFAQEGDLPLSRLPDTEAEFEPYDVFIIGDVPATYFSSKQLVLIRRQVGKAGAGLLWIGGAAFVPHSYEATDLAPLLPMRRPAAVEAGKLPTEGLKLRPSALARAQHILRLRSDTPNVPLNWQQQLPAVYWAQSVGQLKPAAEVLVEAGPAAAPVPIMMRMRYGAGQVVYLATDEIWRFRYGSGGLYVDQIWTQLVRMLGRGRIQQDDQRARLHVSHRRAQLRQELLVNLEIDDPLLLKRQLKRIRVDVQHAAETKEAAIEQIELVPVAPDPDDPPDGTLRYAATWRPTNAGQLLLRVVEPSLVDLDITERLEVVRPDDELRHPQPDHERLEQLATQTGGKLLAPDELEQLAKLVPDNRQSKAQVRSEPLWDSNLALFLVVLLLTTEWIGRKVIRLA